LPQLWLKQARLQRVFGWLLGGYRVEV